MVNDYLNELLVFLGGGALTAIFAFILRLKREERASSSILIGDIYKEIGRLQQELKEVREGKVRSDTENLRLKEENMKLRLEIDALKEEYESLRLVADELRRKIDILLKKGIE